MSDNRDEKADYKAALLDEYESYKRAGRDEDADSVAAVLREQHGHDVKPAAKSADDKANEGAHERADAKPLPETAVPPKPRRGRPPKHTED